MAEPDTSDEAPLLRCADIARLAEVGRAAVTNWIARHPDFPAPRTRDSRGRPLFSLPAVEAWLAKTGRSTRGDARSVAARRSGAVATARRFRHPAAVTAERLVDHLTKWPAEFEPEERDAIDKVVQALRGIADPAVGRGPGDPTLLDCVTDVSEAALPAPSDQVL